VSAVQGLVAALHQSNTFTLEFQLLAGRRVQCGVSSRQEGGGGA
jgi:hypothetical protein